MSMLWIIGLLVAGAIVGILVAALAGAASRGSREEERSDDEERGKLLRETWEGGEGLKPGGVDWAKFFESRSVEFETKDKEGE